MVDGAIVAKHDINFYSEKEVLNLQLFTDNLFHNAFFIGCHPFITDNNIETIMNSFETFFANHG